MKKIIISFAILSLVFINFGEVLANSLSAKQDWLDAKTMRIEATTAYREAQLDFATEPNKENEEKLIEATKTNLDTALEEAEAWLVWKKTESEENIYVPEYIKNDIKTDVSKNLNKIEDLRVDVDKIDNRIEAGVTFLKMVGSYLELLTDVARNTGAMWVYIAEEKVQKIKDYENSLRDAANELKDNEEIISKLDIAKDEIALAEDKIEKAESVYKQVVLPGTPLLKFSEGNNYLRQAKANLLNAFAQMQTAFNLIIQAN